MSDLVFVDTNVLVYSRQQDRSDKQVRSSEWIDALWVRECGRLSIQVMQEFYAAVRKSDRSRAAEARQMVSLYGHWRPLSLDITVLQAAWQIEDRYQTSWWDALILAASHESGCRYLLTEDLQHGQMYGRVQVVNPFQLSPAQVLGPA